MTTPLLDVRDLNVHFTLEGRPPVHAVRGISLTVAPGERLGLVGESGSGKSTALLAILGLLSSNATLSGEIWFDGQEGLRAGDEGFQRWRWNDIAMVFQGAMNALNPVRTVRDQIVEPMVYHGIASGESARARADELLELVGIPHEHGGRFPHQLSGGMRQRAVVAMALSCEPRLILADEPTTALDVMVQAQVLALLEELSSERGLSVILVSHDIAVVSGVCDRVGVMYAGEVVELGPVADVFGNPKHPYTELLLAATPTLFGDDTMRSIPGLPPQMDMTTIGCPFAPRCPRRVDVCDSVAPALDSVGVGHFAACHLNSPVTAEPGRSM